MFLIGKFTIKEEKIMTSSVKYAAMLTVEERDDFVLTFSETEAGERTAMSFKSINSGNFFNVTIEPNVQDIDLVEDILKNNHKLKSSGLGEKFEEVSSW